MARHLVKTTKACLAVLVLLVSACESGRPLTTHLDSLSEVSIPTLRSRTYGSTIQLESQIAPNRFLASYDSDGSRIYTRIDMPEEEASEKGYPVLIFVHGWYGRENAPDFDFMAGPDSVYDRVIGSYVDKGFLVLSPALRGHGTVNGIAAEGIEYLDAWDNASYISPVFYAIDVLNLLEGIHSLEKIDGTNWSMDHSIHLDKKRINIIGHSQGGDVALIALAVSGEGSTLGNTLASGSIWSGCFGARFAQAEIYGPMATTLQAFMSGDGNWTGTANGLDGSVNADFVFGYPPDWIGTLDTNSADWTWQKDTWATPSVKEALQNKFSEMYDVINRQVEDISDAAFEIGIAESGKTVVQHDPRIAGAMEAIGAFDSEEFLLEPIHFHHSDQDYYSIPAWNSHLTKRINQSGGNAVDFVYPMNNHSLLISEYDWFSQGEVIEGLPHMIDRDIRLFSPTAKSENPQ